jgi:peptide-methionine (S)-S-oxide reductase
LAALICYFKTKGVPGGIFQAKLAVPSAGFHCKNKKTVNKQLVNIFIVLTIISLKSMGKEIETATLGGGCFWCTEAIYKELDGVISVTPGFSGGHTKNPSYKEVCTGTTGHAEVVQIEFDPAKVSFAGILEVFFKVHDPTTLNRQGEDVGAQYRSAIFYHSEEQKQTAERIIGELNREKVYDHPVVTEVTKFEAFYPAEDYHKDYFARNPQNPYCSIVIAPKVEKFEKIFKNKLKKQ